MVAARRRGGREGGGNAAAGCARAPTASARAGRVAGVNRTAGSGRTHRAAIARRLGGVDDRQGAAHVVAPRAAAGDCRESRRRHRPSGSRAFNAAGAAYAAGPSDAVSASAHAAGAADAVSASAHAGGSADAGPSDDGADHPTGPCALGANHAALDAATA